MSQKRQPPNWEAYEQGRSASSGSLGSISEDHEHRAFPSSPPHPQDRARASAIQGEEQDLRRRRSSITMRLKSIGQMGGPNSIDNFARSFQRAAGFREITPIRRHSVTMREDEDGEVAGRMTDASSPSVPRSLLRQQFEAAAAQRAEEAAVESTSSAEGPSGERTRLLQAPTNQTLPSLQQLPSPVSDAYGTSYGTISSRMAESARRRASVLIQEQYEASLRAATEEPDKAEGPRPIEREEREDGEIIERQIGESTVPMTVFNAINTLVGIGILALPLGFKYAGWVVGILFLSLAAISTMYTARLLAKCLDTNTGSTTYGDLAFLAFDNLGRGLVEVLFILELLAANVGMIILFADSVNSLIPAIGVLEYKIFIALVLIPLNFVPFRTLGITSVVGIFSCMSIIVIIIIDGIIKPTAPGSLRELTATYAFPADWRTVPLSLGLFMAPWGGHSVFPNIYKDMRHPKKYHQALKYTYVFTYGLDFVLAAVGYLMFGERVRDEVTSNILESKAYPHVLSIIVVVLIAVIPLTKIPLVNRPIQDTINKKFYIDLRQMDEKAREHSEKSMRHRTGRAAVAIACNLLQLALSILVPDFDSIMALMGSALCFTICIILPVSFHLRIFGVEGKGISLPERILNWILLFVCGVMAVTGTVWAILPKEKIGIKGGKGFSF